MTGKQINLEDAINFFLDPAGSCGAYLRFDVNEAYPFGHRVSNLEVNQKLVGSLEQTTVLPEREMDIMSSEKLKIARRKLTLM